MRLARFILSFKASTRNSRDVFGIDFEVLVAVVAFKIAIDFEIRRRENDQKVTALRVQMTEMMCPLLAYVKFYPA